MSPKKSKKKVERMPPPDRPRKKRDRSESPEAGARAGGPGRARGRKAELGAKPERSAKSERGGQAHHFAKPEPSDKPERGSKAARGDQPERSAKPERGSKAARGGQPERGSKAERFAQAERGAEVMVAPASKKRVRAPAPDGILARKPVEPDLSTLRGGRPKEDHDGVFRSGYVALVGRPNVGKSTILNQLLGQKIAATTHKPQTTRKNILGILNPKGAQILLLDTPGFHRAEGPLNRFMVGQSRMAIADADVIGFVVEAREDDNIPPGNQELIDLLVRAEKPVVLLVNKIDRIKDRSKLLLQAEAYRAALGERLVGAAPISALRRRGLEVAVRELAAALPEGEANFSPDELTDQPERAIVAEFIREKVMLETQEELPYATAISIEAFEDLRPKLVRIFATIHVEKRSQKGIVIGRGGDMLKQIGSRARVDIEHVLGAKVFLDLNVRVTEDWASSDRGLELFGYVRGAGEERVE